MGKSAVYDIGNHDLGKKLWGPLGYRLPPALRDGISCIRMESRIAIPNRGISYMFDKPP